MAEKYTLNWHTFSEHLQLMFKDLYQEGRYTDVTLVSDDQTQIKVTQDLEVKKISDGVEIGSGQEDSEGRCY